MNRLTLKNLRNLFDFFNIDQMKKVIVIAFATLILAAVVSSCKTHERCPAYGSVDSSVNADVNA